MSKPEVVIMIDTETLGLQPNSVVTQIAFVAVDAEDPDTVIGQVEEYLPIQPQLNIGRTVDASTIIYWLTSTSVTEAARQKFVNNAGDDMEELTALVQSFVTKISRVIDAAESYTVWCRGPQFDIVKLETLIQQCGLDIPWHYATIRDVRTLMGEAGLRSGDVPIRAGLIPHHALSDCKIQIDQWQESRRSLRSQS